ncbi:unnamed protein product [Diatraea saccharalis]|uniref:MADF domain-containing protein n=1 Tax=Diatraea saccharalis TaxID=40085 RepID=A0A9N9R548_9NEOP|nr:unnamed protein product [Diatraea saccharalis]
MAKQNSHPRNRPYVGIRQNPACIAPGLSTSSHRHRSLRRSESVYSEAESSAQDIFECVEPEATKDTVKKKINSLRTCYRKEMKKVDASTKSGAATDDIYEPTL